jgi:hypothetical protein
VARLESKTGHLVLALPPAGPVQRSAPTMGDNVKMPWSAVRESRLGMTAFKWDASMAVRSIRPGVRQ